MLRIALLTPLLALGLTACELELDADLGSLIEDAEVRLGEDDCDDCDDELDDTGEHEEDDYDDEEDED